LVQFSDWVQLVQVFATLGLIYYAYATISEARKDRKKDMIERMLEKIYFPMFEILDRARKENGLRAMVRTWPVQIGDSEERLRERSRQRMFVGEKPGRAKVSYT
jgi:hypothetical protein